MCCKSGDQNAKKPETALWMSWLTEAAREVKVISKVRTTETNYWHNLKVIYIKIPSSILDAIIKMFLNEFTVEKCEICQTCNSIN